MKNIGEMMRQAQQMQQRMQEMQDRLAETEATGRSGAGMVEVTLNGKGAARRIRIDPQLDGGGHDATAAVGAAASRSRDAASWVARSRIRLACS